MILYTFSRYLRRALLVALLCAALPAACEQLTLDEAVRIALSNNPSVLAAREDARAAELRTTGARALANPVLAVVPGLSGRAGSDEEFLFSQPLEINGARRARARIARGLAGQAASAAAAVERDIARQAGLAYWDAVLAETLVDLAGQNVAHAEALHAAATRQVEVGSLPGAQAIKSELELARARQELVRAESELAQAQAALNAILGREAGSNPELADPLRYVPINFDAATLQAAAQENRPEVREAVSGLESSRGEADAARAARRPDLAIQARKETFGGDGGLAVGVTFPIWDWGSARAERRSAGAAAAAAEQRVASTRNAVALDVHQSIARLEEADSLVRGYEQGILAQSQQLADMAEKGYRAGATGYLEVLEAQRTLRDVRAEYYRAVAAHLKAKADLVWATAVEIRTSEEAGK